MLKDKSLLKQGAYIGSFISAANNSKQSLVRVYDPGFVGKSGLNRKKDNGLGDVRKEMKALGIDYDDNGHIGNVLDCDKNAVNKAIDISESKLHLWGYQMTAKERSTILKEVARLHHAHLDDLAKILTLESGKPIGEAKGEILYGASYFEWFAEQCKRGGGEIIPSPIRSRELLSIRQPVGVASLITPWNFPNAMLARKAAAALAAGCTIVCKPAEATPFSALALAELCYRAGLPEGVMNVVPCKRDNVNEIGELLSSHQKIRKVSFTGSTAVGKVLMGHAAKTVKRVSMELGGNAPFIIFEDADLKSAVDGVISCKFRNNGQTCVCANRILVHESIHDKFVQLLVERVNKLRIGHGLYGGETGSGTDVDLGPLINESAVNKCEALLSDATSNNAKVLTGGERLGGNFFKPTVVLSNMDMKIAKEEIFGPIASVLKFKTEEEAVQIANNTTAGLASYFYSRDVGRVLRVSRLLQYGMVGVNSPIISNDCAPFGGIKEYVAVI